MKIAFDENMPAAMVRVFALFHKERSLKDIVKGFTLEQAKDYTPAPGHPDYVKGDDVPWVRRFAKAGGKVIISGDTAMKAVPHERLALVQEGMIVVFFERQWSRWPFCQKAALLLHWWPVILKTVKRAKAGSFFHVPCSWPAEKGKLRRVSNEDAKLVRIERQLAAKAKKQRARSRGRPPVTAQVDMGFPERRRP